MSVCAAGSVDSMLQLLPTVPHAHALPCSTGERVCACACAYACACVCAGACGCACVHACLVQRCAWKRRRSWQHPNKARLLCSGVRGSTTLRTLRWHDATLARFVPRLTCVRIQALPSADHEYVMWRASCLWALRPSGARTRGRRVVLSSYHQEFFQPLV